MAKLRYRTASIDATRTDDESQIIQLSFSSDRPIRMGDVSEVLVHTREAADFSRLNDGGALLMDHDPTKQVGVIEKAWIEGGKGRATVRFSRSALGREIFQDVLDGVRRNISVGYSVLKHSIRNGIRYVNQWQAAEVSLVAVAADAGVGVGRSYSKPTNLIRKNHMSKRLKELNERRGAVLDKIEEIDANEGADGLSESDQFTRDNLVEIARDYSRQIAAEETAVKRGGANSFHIGNSDVGKEKYSLLRAIRNFGKSGYEQEVSDDIAKRHGTSAKGLLVPMSTFAKRDVTATGGTGLQQGGVMIAEDKMAFVEALKNRLTVARLGARVLDNLSGDVSIPRAATSASVSWKTENAQLDESSPTYDELDLSPNRVGSYVEASKQLLIQTSNGAEQIIRDDLLSAIAVELDRVAIEGSGASNQPTGIINTTGIGSVVGGVAGAAPTWNNVSDLVKEVAVDNANEEMLSFLTNPKVRAKLQQTAKVSGTDSVNVWDAVQNFGFRNVAVSNNVPSDLTKSSSTGLSAIIVGDFSDLIVATWGDYMDLVIDPYTKADLGLTRILSNVYADIGVRRAVSFAAMLDAVTS